ncbi:isopentenyl-diphosphate delta-isomerase [Candidatus Woesearchaeota archaeon]|nr:isopentenyl-diphosphate delta-isomerase [Candidatus Woesearchaeota archaeon]
MNELIVVDKKDNIISFELKDRCHDGDGILHRAFSVFVFNDKKQLLIQQRSRLKRLWPLYWSNTCCSHPRQNEGYKEAAERRLREEIGISCKLKYLFKFRYRATYYDIGSENEICAVLIGRSNDSIILNKEEIANYKWISLKELAEDISQNPEIYTPWFKLEFRKLISSYRKEL